MNRRHLFFAGPAMMAIAGSGAAATVPNPDADLIAVCAEFNACDRQQRAIYDGPDAIEDEGEAALATAPIFARMEALLTRMEHLRAASPFGIAARASSLAQHSGGMESSFDAQDTITGRLLGCLLRDGAAVQGVAVVPSACPDAALIAHCDQLDVLERAYLATDFAADDGTPAGDAAEVQRERIVMAQEPIVDAICASPPRTLAGAVAVAHSLALWDAELLKGTGEGNCTDSRLIAALVRGLTASASVPVPSSDIELLALCAKFQRLHSLSYLPGNNDWETPLEARWGLSSRIEKITPVTQAGHWAKAAVAVTVLDENRCDGEFMGGSDARFALSTLRDWLGMMPAPGSMQAAA